MNEKRRANALMAKYYSGMIDEGSWKTAAGDIAVFNTKYRKNLKSLIVQLEPIQEGSGDPSPDNVRPISGWTGANIYLEHAYDAQATPIKTVSWQTEAGTVYGGTIDVVSGVLKVDSVKHIVTSSDTVGLFQQGVNAGRIAVGVPDSKLSPNNVARTDLICSISKPSATIPMSSSLFEVGYCCMYSAGPNTYSKFIICIPSNIGSANDARNWLIENNCEFVYKLATPQTYQLTPQQIQTLVGENVIWSDAGPVSVEYWS